jgi:hypothetical protein
MRTAREQELAAHASVTPAPATAKRAIRVRGGQRMPGVYSRPRASYIGSGATRTSMRASDDAARTFMRTSATCRAPEIEGAPESADVSNEVSRHAAVIAVTSA